MRFRVVLLALALSATAVAQEPQLRFRAGANLVRVDAYVAKDGVALTDLRREDIEVYEDDKLQTIEQVELIKARGPIPQTERINPTTVRAACTTWRPSRIGSFNPTTSASGGSCARMPSAAAPSLAI